MTVYNEHVWPGLPEPLDNNPRCKVCGHKATPHHHFANPPICLLCPQGICQDGPAGVAYRESLTASSLGPVGRTHEDPKAPSE